MVLADAAGSLLGRKSCPLASRGRTLHRSSDLLRTEHPKTTQRQEFPFCPPAPKMEQLIPQQLTNLSPSANPPIFCAFTPAQVFCAALKLLLQRRNLALNQARHPLIPISPSPRPVPALCTAISNFCALVSRRTSVFVASNLKPETWNLKPASNTPSAKNSLLPTQRQK
jgi:hypothetical protein